MGQWLILLGLVVCIVIALKKFSTTTKLRIAIILLVVGTISMFLSTQGPFANTVTHDMIILVGVAGLLIGGIFLAGSIGSKKNNPRSSKYQQRLVSASFVAKF